MKRPSAPRVHRFHPPSAGSPHVKYAPLPCPALPCPVSLDWIRRASICLPWLNMDSPHLQSPHPLQRMRTTSNLSVHPVDKRGAIQKRSIQRARSVSTSQAERLHHFAVNQINSVDRQAVPPTSIAPQWITPQHSPQPQLFSDPPVDHFPQWTVPTPPRSDSGVPTVSVDANDVPVTTGISSTQDFSFEQPTASAEMR
jgi:hypothetical protein